MRIKTRTQHIKHINGVPLPDTVVPIGWIAVGDPAQVLPPLGTVKSSLPAAISAGRVRA
jgi:hypothetical protein